MRERLLKLLKEADDICSKTKQCEGCIGFGKGEECVNFLIADHLLANGVIVPPCKVGDAVYYIGGYLAKDVYEAKVEEIYIGEARFAFHLCSDYSYFTLQQEEVFLTREEAEAALKGR